ncbi:MAG TPA: right-handed parallel beta-helix repeat-containing protein [Dehalococcoidia bacterium]|nr:right-handed parallel beta-helix repeat-containing protein [Dehalococcoidia bacterium]
MPGTRNTRRTIALAVVMAAISMLFSGSLRTGQPAAEAADCNKLAFLATLQPLVDAAAPGDVICMAPGVYRGPVTFQNKQGVTLRGMGPRISIVAGGDKDSMLIFNSSDLTFEDFTLFYGHPSNSYVWQSNNIVFQRMDVGGGAIGIHYDVGSTGRVSDSFVYAMDGDGILIRRKSNVTVERNWVFNNGGVGVSTVGDTATTTITRNIISDNKGPGVFAGQTPCALLPPGHVEVPSCYLRDLQSFVGQANIILSSNVIQFSGSTGIVMFPGTTGTFNGNHIWFNKLTGLFAWGANVQASGDEYNGNEEHAIEFRAYPDPLKYGQVGPQFPVRAVGNLDNMDIHDSVVLSETGTLGGGVLAQGANIDVRNSHIYRNRGIGISYVNTSLGTISGNTIDHNGGSAVCIYRAGTVVTSANTAYNNADNTIGDCLETTP